MGQKENKEKEKFVRETVTKYFFDMSKSTYTIMVLGGLAAAFGIVKTEQEETFSAILVGVCLTVVLAMIGLFLKNKDMNTLGLTFAICLVPATAFLIWLVTPWGKNGARL